MSQQSEVILDVDVDQVDQGFRGTFTFQLHSTRKLSGLRSKMQYRRRKDQTRTLNSNSCIKFGKYRVLLKTDQNSPLSSHWVSRFIMLAVYALKA